MSHQGKGGVWRRELAAWAMVSVVMIATAILPQLNVYPQLQRSYIAHLSTFLNVPLSPIGNGAATFWVRAGDGEHAHAL